MAIEPIKVPQNIYIEDRIVGPLTLKQIIITVIGGGFSYAIWTQMTKMYGEVSIPITVIAWIPAVIAAAFAFVKINDLSLIRIIFLLIERTQKPGKRTFSPRTGLSIHFRTNAPEEGEQKRTQEKKKLNEPLKDITDVLDSDLPTLTISTKKPAQKPHFEDGDMHTDLPPPAEIQSNNVQSPSNSPVTPPPGESSVSLFRDIHPPA